MKEKIGKIKKIVREVQTTLGLYISIYIYIRYIIKICKKKEKTIFLLIFFYLSFNIIFVYFTQLHLYEYDCCYDL